MELKKELDTLRKREQKLLAAYDRSLGDNLKESSVKGHYRERHWVKKHVRKVRPRKLSEKMFK